MTTSKECPKCGAALFWAEDIGSHCTSCGWKQAARQTQGGTSAEDDRLRAGLVLARG